MDMPVKTTESLDLFVNATQQFERALTWVDGIKEGIIDFLINPKRTIHVRFPVNMDDGSARTFHGFRVETDHSLFQSPAFYRNLDGSLVCPGYGLHYHPDVVNH